MRRASWRLRCPTGDIRSRPPCWTPSAHRGHRSVDTIRWRLAGDERLTDVGRALAAAGLLRRGVRGREPWSLTKAGREALRRLAAQPPVDPALDGGSASLVALHGREAMPDPGLRAAIFERPALPSATGPGVRPPAPRGAPASGTPTTPRWLPTRPGTRLRRAAAIGFIDGGIDGGGG